MGRRRACMEGMGKGKERERERDVRDRNKKDRPYRLVQSSHIESTKNA